MTPTVVVGTTTIAAMMTTRMREARPTRDLCTVLSMTVGEGGQRTAHTRLDRVEPTSEEIAIFQSYFPSGASGERSAVVVR